MSRAARGESAKVVLGDTDLFFFYLRGGTCERQAEAVVRQAGASQIALRTSSEVYDDAISAIRADGLPLAIAESFVSDMKSIPHLAYPMSAEVAQEALRIYSEQGGRRRLSYFDSFHVATAKRYGVELVTSDKFVLANAGAFGIRVLDLADWK